MPDEPELRDYMLPFLDVDDPIVIRMRHEPAPASARLLVSLGAGWIVDENAPSCVRNCGQPECEIQMRVSAHDMLVSRDCVFPGCPREAANGRNACDECTRNPPIPVDDAALFGAFDDDPRGDTPMTTTCKHCTNPAEDERGIYAHLCAHHKELARTARASGNGGGHGH